MNKRIALGAVSLTALVPSTAAGPAGEPGIKTDFTLTKSGLDAASAANINAVANRMGRRVGFGEIFTQDRGAAHARARRPSGAQRAHRLPLGGRQRGRVRLAPAGHHGQRRRVPERDGRQLQGADHQLARRADRVLAHDAAQHDGRATPARPTGTCCSSTRPAADRCSPCQSHAGGLAWIGNFLYVASTTRLLVFKLSDLIKVKPELRGEVRTYDYILPLAGRYTPAARRSAFSSVSLDRSQKRPALVTSEFKRERGRRAHRALPAQGQRADGHDGQPRATRGRPTSRTSRAR